MVKEKLKLISQIKTILLQEEQIALDEVQNEFKKKQKINYEMEDFVNEIIFNYKNFFIIKNKKEQEIINKTEPIRSFLISRMNEKIKFILKFKEELSENKLEFVYQLLLKKRENWRKEDEMFLDDIFNILVQKIKIDVEFEKILNLKN